LNCPVLKVTEAPEDTEAGVVLVEIVAAEVSAEVVAAAEWIVAVTVAMTEVVVEVVMAVAIGMDEAVIGVTKEVTVTGVVIVTEVVIGTMAVREVVVVAEVIVLEVEDVAVEVEVEGHRLGDRLPLNDTEVVVVETGLVEVVVVAIKEVKIDTEAHQLVGHPEVHRLEEDRRAVHLQE